MNNIIRTVQLILYCTIAVYAIGQNPNWQSPDPSVYNYSANIVAIIQHNDIPSHNNQDEIALIADDIVHGVSKAIEIAPNEYRHFITVYSNQPTDTMDIKIYHVGKDSVYTVAKPLVFGIQNVYGSVDNPVVYNVYDDDDAPIYLSDIPNQKTLETHPFMQIDLEAYLIQVDNQTVNWSYDANPNLNVSLSGSILNVSGADDFSGTALLTIGAIENPSIPEGAAELKLVAPPRMAETTISFEVVEFFQAPEWDFINGQDILKGDQFTDIPLHDFELKHPRPTIIYDYEPVVQEVVSPVDQPAWAFDNDMPTSMTFISRIDYTPRYQFEHEDDMIAAYIGEELRGVARIDDERGLYFLTVAGNSSELYDVELYFYSGLMKKVLPYRIDIPYTPHQILGSVDAPYILDMSPIIPRFPEDEVVDGIATIPVDIVDTSFSGQVYFRFIAADPEFPMYRNDTSKTYFCIASDSSALRLSLDQVDIINEFCPEATDAYLEVFADCPDCAGSLEYSLDGVLYQSSEYITNLDSGYHYIHVRDTEYLQCEQLTRIYINQGVIDHPPLVDLSAGIEDWSDHTLIYGTDSNNNDKFGNAIDIYDRYGIVGAERNDENGSNAGAAYIYERLDGTLIQEKRILASDGQASDNFGCAVAMTENYAIVGARLDDDNGSSSGAAYLYRREYDEWSEIQKLTPSDGQANNFFGSAVDIHDKHLAIGANGVNNIQTDAGAVYTYRQIGTEWMQTGKLIASDFSGFDHFGFDVKIFGDWMIVGAPDKDTPALNEGRAYVFHYENGLWSEHQILAPPSGDANDNFGYSVSIFADKLIIGAPGDDDMGSNAGAAYVYQNIEDSWSLLSKVIADDGQAGDKFAEDVDISLDRLIIGSSGDDDAFTSSGSAYVFTMDESGIIQSDKIVLADPMSGDAAGTAVSISNKNILVSVPNDDDNGNNTGSVYSGTLNYTLAPLVGTCEVTLEAPTAFGHCGGELVGTTDTVLSNSGEEEVITWTFTDTDGTVFTLDQMISLGDTIPPMLMCVDLSIVLDEDGQASISAEDVVAESSDNCGIKEISLSQTDFSCSDVGDNIIMIIAEDNSGNRDTCSTIINVRSSLKTVLNQNNDGTGSLREMISLACGSDTIYFDSSLQGFDIEITSELTIEKTLTILGIPNLGINADHLSRIFNISSDVTLDLRTLDLKNGEETTAGGALINDGTLLLSNINFINNKEDGQAKALTNNGTIIIKANTTTNIN